MSDPQDNKGTPGVLDLSGMNPEEFFDFSYNHLQGIAAQNNQALNKAVIGTGDVILAHYRNLVTALHQGLQHAENELAHLRLLELHVNQGRLTQEAYEKITKLINEARKAKADYAAKASAALNQGEVGVTNHS